MACRRRAVICIDNDRGVGDGLLMLGHGSKGVRLERKCVLYQGVALLLHAVMAGLPLLD